MEINEMFANLRDAFLRLASYRLIVSSPREKVADVPLFYALFLLWATPVVCAGAVVLGLILRYGARFERDVPRAV